MRIAGDKHLTYCTNVHPGETWDETFVALRTHIPQVKRRVCPAQAYGIGLRLSAAAAQGLEADGLAEFQRWLADEDCYVFTLNGFPYGAFHSTEVKARVFDPDWTTPSRYDYTCRLARLLAELLPQGVTGSISTSPLAYGRSMGINVAMDKAVACAEQLTRVAEYLAGLERTKRCLIRLGLEPEPDGLIETTSGFLRFFDEVLLPAGQRLFGPDAEPMLRRHIGLCLDTCHASVVGERLAGVLPAIRKAGVALAKLQISAALRVDWQGEDEQVLRDRLQRLDDHVYLHQVRVYENRQCESYVDLLPALEDGARGEWRIHFHVPIDASYIAGLASTHEETAHLLRSCLEETDCAHLEIETYTWDVLPDAHREDLHDSIAREFRWVMQQLPVQTTC